jgi:hypothetical protein
MAYEFKEGDISIFRNDKKTSDNQPSHRGKMMLNGQIYKISAWTKGKPGETFLSGKVEIDTYVKQDGLPVSESTQEEPF